MPMACTHRLATRTSKANKRLIFRFGRSIEAEGGETATSAVSFPFFSIPSAVRSGTRRELLAHAIEAYIIY